MRLIVYTNPRDNSANEKPGFFGRVGRRLLPYAFAVGVLTSFFGCSADNSDPPPVLEDLAIESSPLADAFTGQPYRYPVVATARNESIITYTLLDGPTGMTVQPVTGVVTWTPVECQAVPAAVSIKATDSVGNMALQDFIINVVFDLPDLPGIYVSPDGEDSAGRGASDMPFATITYAAKQSQPGDTVFVRGGTYQNSTYGDGDPDVGGSAVGIKTSGTAALPIRYQPYGNEKVKIRYDGKYGVTINASYIVFDGFEVAGPALSISYADVISAWWENGPSMYNAHGIIARGHHNTIENCVVHDACGKGIGAWNFDYVTVRNNIVYNCSWWTIGGTDGICLQSPTAFDASPGVHTQIHGNLVFNCEQRIMSRSWSNGSAQLTIDESAGVLMQSGWAAGFCEIYNNLSLFNGKGINPQFATSDVRIFNNSIYVNGTTIGGVTSGVVMRSLSNCLAERNAVHARLDHVALNGVTNNTFTDNYVIGRDTPANLSPGNYLVDRLFRDPDALDFRLVSGIPDNIGVPEVELDRMMQMAGEYGIKEIRPTLYVVDYYGQTETIKNSQPAGSTFVLNIHYPDPTPETYPETYDVVKDTILDVEAAEGVVANDTNPMEGALEAQLVSNTHNGVLTLSSEGDFNYVPNPAHNGVLTLSSEGDFNYVPNPGFVGEDSFWYKTHDGMNKSNMTKVSIVVYSP
jgi:hypothetical protein